MSGRRARKWLMAGIKMEGNTEMDKVLLGRTSEFQVFFMMAMVIMVAVWNVHHHSTLETVGWKVDQGGK